MFGAPTCLVIDNFLSPDEHAALIAHALSHEAQFEPTVVWYEGERVINQDSRISWKCTAGLGAMEECFGNAMRAVMPQAITVLGVPKFALEKTETELIAHRDGAFFERHVDTLTEAERDQVKSDRMISLVYYFHTSPKRFSGGELLLYPLGPGEPKTIEPLDNRLVAFASFMPHEVKPVVIGPGDSFADARFAVNCWLHRSRQPR